MSTVTNAQHSSQFQILRPLQAYQHLCIGQKIIICQLQHQLRDAATISKYQNYLQNKSQWNDNIQRNIHWKISQLMLQWLMHANRQLINKFMRDNNNSLIIDGYLSPRVYHHLTSTWISPPGGMTQS